MSDMAIISLISLMAWLFFAGSALLSYRLGWGRLVQMALIWVAIFAGGFAIATALM